MKSLINIRFGSFCALVFLLGINSCSTEKNKFFNRAYHNTTAKFNGYFNANEVIKEALIDFHTQNKDDYTKILPVFIIPDDAKSKSLYAPMDKAIGKTGVVIKKHAMPNAEKHANKKEEWCKWIDNNWLVMGIGYFYKRDFNEARIRFEYVFKQYQADPIKYEAWLWEAKTFMELGDFVNAQTYLDKLQEKFEEQTDKQKIAAKKAKDAKAKKSKSKSKSKKPVQNLNPDMDSKMYDDIQQTWADFHLRKKEWTKAEERLKKAIAITKSKKQKARLYFILGQLYQQKGDRAGANLMYARVDKMNPEYEMEFYSRIFRALNYDGGSSFTLKRQLLKMAKDDKNKDYLDQIYYALAEIEFKENNIDNAVTYLKKSVKYSTTNNRQKGLSYKRLGDFYYEKKKFIHAKSYYDSTMASLPPEYENYAKVKEKSESLKDLVTNLLVIQNEDSLQRMRNMTLPQLEKYVEGVIIAEDKEKERKRQAEENAAAKDPQTPVANNGGNGWYFYNPAIMAQGFTAFKKAWGVRKLEDNWRRSDKSTSGEFVEDTTDNTTTAPESADMRKRIDDRIAKLARDQRALDAAKGRLIEALYSAGTIYNDRLREEKLAVELFTRLIKDYEDSKNGLPAHYQMFVINKEDKTGPHATWILTKHPDSEYAKLILNPAGVQNEALVRQGDVKKYEDAFYGYKRKDYENVLLACNDVISKEPKNSMLPKYYFLRAMTYGEMKKMPEFESALSETAAKYPKEEVGIAAAELLGRVRNKVSIDNAAQGKSTYIYEKDAEHFFVLVFTSKMGSVNDAKAKISNFNSSDFGLDNLKITNTFLNTDDQVILVKGFKDSKKALDYYSAFKSTDMVKGLNGDADFFIITNKNYASFYVEKVVADYVKFFKENYLK
ncbi:MAG TPA: tetratricopeptide repeat protein [Flavobacteriales bacterium]|nr:tetratricopeptide repeat protein [Flavobacteriales bacterium]